MAIYCTPRVTAATAVPAGGHAPTSQDLRLAGILLAFALLLSGGYVFAQTGGEVGAVTPPSATSASPESPDSPDPVDAAAAASVSLAVAPPTGSEPSFLLTAGLPIPPRITQEEFVNFMASNRNEDKKFLELRYQRCKGLLANKDLSREKEINAFLLTPREKFCRPWNLKRAYDHAFLDIHYGVTISGPYLVGRMTAAIDVKPGEKVLEIGTGSGYQAAILSHLTDQVYTVEIIEPLASETDRIYSDLTAAGYPHFGKIRRKADDGYAGWPEHAPYDKIIVTCGIDHIPPELLQQLKPGGIMVIPVGSPGAQVVLKVAKTVDEDGDLVITREDIYHGRKKVPFVPFTKKGGGTHNGQ